MNALGVAAQSKSVAEAGHGLAARASVRWSGGSTPQYWNRGIKRTPIPEHHEEGDVSVEWGESFPIDRLCDEVYPQARILRQVTGVGPVISLTYVATIENPSRFSRSRVLGAYLGLVPRTYQSGNSDPQLRISKTGDRELRRLLVSAATYMLRRSSPDCDLKRYGKRVARGNSPRDRNRARVAVARKLAVLLHRLWVTGEVYRPLQERTSAA